MPVQIREGSRIAISGSSSRRHERARVQVHARWLRDARERVLPLRLRAVGPRAAPWQDGIRSDRQTGIRSGRSSESDWLRSEPLKSELSVHLIFLGTFCFLNDWNRS